MGLFADRCGLIGSENAFKVGPHITHVDATYGKVLRLNLGEPDFNIADCMKKELHKQIDANNSHYCDPKGIPSLRKAVADLMKRTRGLSVSPDQVVVFPGAKPAIGFAQLIYCNPGDEVIYPSPGYPIYESFVSYIGAVPKPLHLDEKSGFVFAPEMLEELIGPKTKLIFINFPSNPTGGAASRELLEKIAAVILKKAPKNVRIFSDEIYEDICFDGKKNFSIASVPGMAERTMILSGFSKGFAWTGGRLGYAILPTLAEADQFKNLNINYFSCVPPFVQEAAREGLENPEAAAHTATMVATFQKRRDMVLGLLAKVRGLQCQCPKGAFYLFPNISQICESLGIIDAYERLSPTKKAASSPATLFQYFALYCHKVAVLDRRSFGAIGSEGKHFIRLSIANSDADLKEGVRRLDQASQDKEGFWRFYESPDCARLF